MERMTMLVRARIGLMLAAWALSLTTAVADQQPLRFSERDRVEFRPADGESLTLPVTLEEQGRVTLELYTGDGDRIRRIQSDGEWGPGDHAFTWDGRDERGEVVPDEAYHPVLVCQCAGAGEFTVDPRESSGGRIMDLSGVGVDSDGVIQYVMPRPGRVLVRVGVEGGAMLRGLDTWVAKAGGAHRRAWDGRDHAGRRIVNGPDLTYLVRAFSLPEHTVITSGNEAVSYRAYRKARGWERPEFDPQSVEHEHDGQRLARQAQMPVSLQQDPEVSIEIVDGTEAGDGVPVAAGSLTFRVDMPQRDRWLMQQSLYEVAFFLDDRFVSEEENGYVPLTWRWVGDLEPGMHTMTVNITGLWGQVGVDTVRFRVPEPSGKSHADGGPVADP